MTQRGIRSSFTVVDRRSACNVATHRPYRRELHKEPYERVGDTSFYILRGTKSYSGGIFKAKQSDTPPSKPRSNPPRRNKPDRGIVLHELNAAVQPQGRETICLLPEEFSVLVFRNRRRP